MWALKSEIELVWQMGLVNDSEKQSLHKYCQQGYQDYTSCTQPYIRSDSYASIHLVHSEGRCYCLGSHKDHRMDHNPTRRGHRDALVWVLE